MMSAIHLSPWRRPVRRTSTTAVVTMALLLVAAFPWPVAAHGPDPALGGGLFGQNQDLRFRWRAGSEPIAAIRTAIKAAAGDANTTRNSRAATFTYDAAGTNPIGYGLGATCGVNGLACFTRNAPTGFTMWLREQGHVFDWGTLKWCQTYATPPNGCYDAENIALDEFGHVEGLAHHDNYDDDRDYLDAVVQTFSRAKPAAGYNVHVLGRCDVATLQLQYDVPSTSAKYSTCLDLATDLALSASRSVNTISLRAYLGVVDADSYLRVGGNAVSGRVVTLQRRPTGSATWSTVGSMTPGAAGTYTMTYQIYADTEFRAVFKAPSDEGLRGDTSGTISFTAFICAGTAGPTVSVPCV